MTVQRAEVGLVSSSDDLVSFYRDVFELNVLEPRDLPTGKVHRLGIGDAILKVMVPATRPAPAPAPSDQFWDTAGMRYFSLWVDDLDAVAHRCPNRGGTISLGPLELRPGVRTMVIRDLDGNTVEVMEDRS